MARVLDRVVPTEVAPRALRSVDGSSLAVFRFGFGAIVAWEVWRAFDHNLIRADYDIPAFQFRWWLFEWVRPLPGPLLYLAFAALGLAAVCVALGRFYRPAAVVQFAGLAYWFLLDKSSYLNHRYLAVLFALLLIIIPAYASTVPRWSVWLLRFQVGVPYFFAGIAKLNGDWLVRNEPLRTWFADMTGFPVIGRFLVEPGVVRFMALSSAALDLCVPFLLLHRRTRTAAYGFALLFHLLNARLFEIGIFPWMMIVATTVFFEPDWPRRMVSSLRSGSPLVRGTIVAGGVLGFAAGAFLPTSFVLLQALAGAFGVSVLAFHIVSRQPAPVVEGRVVRPPKRLLVVALACYIGSQLLLPLRHLAIPGNSHWTDEGQRFSWHMLLNSKRTDVAMRVTDPETGRTWLEPLDRHLSNYQMRKLRSPDQILQLAHEIERSYGRDLEVRALTSVSLNGRPSQSLIRPKVDLTEVSRPYIPPADWILPLRPI